MNNNSIEEISKIINLKGNVKLTAYYNTLNTMRLIKSQALNIISELNRTVTCPKEHIPVEYKDKGDFELEIKFGSDILIFMMHTNVFKFSRYHDIMKTPYVKKNSTRAYCGLINIYNFLVDSFKYERTNDVGYMIGRLFINEENHFYIEGKREIAMIYNNFASSIISEKTIHQILLSSILYTVNFDLLVPPYDDVNVVTVQDMIERIEKLRIKTGKRLGFKFQADK